MPDDRTIVYSAASHGYTPELFVINPNTEAPQALGVPNAQLLSVSSKGELAIILGARHLDQRLFGGTLARMTIGSTPRPVLDGVREADWSPDGGSLAITICACHRTAVVSPSSSTRCVSTIADG